MWPAWTPVTKFRFAMEIKVMTLTRFVPFRSGLSDASLLQNRLNAIFHEIARPEVATDGLATGNFVPAVDVYEDAQKLVLKLEVPGIRKEDLKVSVEGRTLTVKGQRKFESEEKEENFHRIERRFGSFARSFTLPARVNAEDVNATTSEGVLSITLAKKAEEKPRQIEVQVGQGPAVAVAQPTEVEGDSAKA
jgi:HSP20 family protein